MAEAAALRESGSTMTEGTSETDSIDQTLSEEDLPKILSILHGAIHKWERIATFLKFKEGSVMTIKSKDIPSEDKLLEVIRRWLKNVSPAPTVRSLVEALKDRYIGEDKIAQEVMEEFCPHSTTHTSLQKSLSSDTQVVPHHMERIDRSESSPAAMSSKADIQPLAQILKTPESESDVEMPHTMEPITQTNPVNEQDVERRSSYKLLELDKMTELERRTLMGRLTNDYKRITASYSKLNQCVIQSLEDRSISTKQLFKVLMHLNAFCVQKDEKAKPLLADNLNNIREAEAIDDIFYILQPYGSFFDCHVIRHVVNSHLCTDQDREELQKYEEELTAYCRRSIFECPHIENMDPRFPNFVMKVDDSVLKSAVMKAIDAFRVEVAEACGLEGHTLHFCSVEEGCLQLTFQVPPCVVDSVFPITYKQKADLKTLGVLKLTCGPSWEYNFENHKRLACAWRKLFGRCTYGDDCRYDHDVEPIQEPFVGDLPQFATVSAAKKISPSGHISDGKCYAIVFSEQQSGEVQMKLVAEDKHTWELAYDTVQSQLQLLREDTRLKYSYIHPDGIKQPVLYAFKKPENASNFQLERIKPKEPVKQVTIEDFDHLPIKHVTPAYSRLHRHKRNVYPIQLMRDYKDDILKQLKQGLCWMKENRLKPLIEGRFGKFTWKKSLHDECLGIQELITLSKEFTASPGLRYYTFHTKVNSDAAIVLKNCFQQICPQEKTYTFTLVHTQSGSESYRVKIKFDDNQKPLIIYTRKFVHIGEISAPKVRVILDILCLHRKYDIRISLADFQTVENPSVTQFITSTIEMSEPGVLHYNPTLSQEKWSVDYIRYHESETFEFKDPYVVEISAVGELKGPGDKESTILPRDFQRRHEIELHCNSPALNPNLRFPIAQDEWTPDGIMEDLQETGFLQMMEDLNAQLDEH